MTFHTRNTYYLRISSSNVLPLYLYLDERHLDWMSDRVLQYVLADLRPLIAHKLQAEANAHLGLKKGTVDVKRGDFYQFAYFLRKTEPHSVLIKTRTFGAVPRQTKQAGPAPKPRSSRNQNGKRKSITVAENPGKKRKTKGKERARTEDSNDEFETSSGNDSDPLPCSPRLKGKALRQSNRIKKSVTGGYNQDAESDADYIDSDAFEDVEDVEMITQDPSVDPWATAGRSVDGAILVHSQTRKPSATFVKEELRQDTVAALSNTANPVQEEAMMEAEPFEIELVVDEEETKPKPLLQLAYRGFNIFGNCLCVVVEPWPPIRVMPCAPSIAPVFLNAARVPDIAPPDFIPSEQVKSTERERTPLFLPDPDRGRSETPAPFSQGRMLPPVPLFNDPVDRDKDGIDGESLMEFSQALNYAGEQRGGLEEDDEMDGSVFFGDADETREF